MYSTGSVKLSPLRRTFSFSSTCKNLEAAVERTQGAELHPCSSEPLTRFITSPPPAASPTPAILHRLNQGACFQVETVALTLCFNACGLTVDKISDTSAYFVFMAFFFATFLQVREDRLAVAAAPCRKTAVITTRRCTVTICVVLP